jgi:hypothetical protein
MSWLRSVALLGIAALGSICLSVGAAAQCPTTYPFSNNCPLPAPGLNAALAARAQHVVSNTVLLTTSTVDAPNGLWRDDYALGFGASPLYYQPSNLACPLNSGNGDNGSQVKSLDGKCWLAVFPPEGPSAVQFGADKVGVNDSTTALQSCLTAAGAGSQCRISHGGKIKILGNITIPAYTSLDCLDGALLDAEDHQTNFSTLPAILLDGTRTISAGGNGAKVTNCLIYRNGMTFPIADATGYTGTALSAAGNDNFTVTNSVVIGFDTAITTYGGRRAYIENVRLDGSGVTNAVLYGGNNGDIGYYNHIKIQSLAGGSGGSPVGCGVLRPGTGMKLSLDQVQHIDDIVIQNFQTAHLSLIGGTSVQQHYIGRIWVDYPWFICSRGTSVGVAITSSPSGSQSFITFGSAVIAGVQTGMTIDGVSPASDTSFGYLFLGGIGQDGVQLGSATPTSAGHLRINSLVAGAPRYAINVLDTNNNSWIDVAGGVLASVNGGAAPYIKVPANYLANRVRVSDTLKVDLADPSGVYGVRGISGCTGVGTGSCAFVATDIADPLQGAVQLAPAGTPSTDGAVTVTLPIGFNHGAGCVAVPAVAGSLWPAGSTLQTQAASSSSFMLDWHSPSALTAGQTYQISYRCRPL